MYVDNSSLLVRHRLLKHSQSDSSSHKNNKRKDTIDMAWSSKSRSDNHISDSTISDETGENPVINHGSQSESVDNSEYRYGRFMQRHGRFLTKQKNSCFEYQTCHKFATEY